MLDLLLYVSLILPMPLVGTMTSAPDEIDQRLIHYKHCDANFYQTGAFNIGRLVSSIPQVRDTNLAVVVLFCFWLSVVSPSNRVFPDSERLRLFRLASRFISWLAWIFRLEHSSPTCVFLFATLHV